MASMNVELFRRYRGALAAISAVLLLVSAGWRSKSSPSSGLGFFCLEILRMRALAFAFAFLRNAFMVVEAIQRESVVLLDWYGWDTVGGV